MVASTLLPDTAELRLDCLISEPSAVTIVARTCREITPCPDCQQPSRRVHSRYVRTLADLPWNGVTVRLRLHTRRFFCVSSTCRRHVFTERLPGTAGRYARRTARLNEALQVLGRMVGGEPGVRLAQKLGIHTSADTLLRCTRQHRAAMAPTPRVLGVDDWAWKRGSRYGTILVDLERHAVVDLLPDREAGSLKHWLQQHPGVEVISRDRSPVYADGASQGAPQATQVADRWHLLRNVGQALQTMVEREAAHLAPAAEEAQVVSVCTPAPVAAPEPSGLITPVTRPQTRSQQVSAARRSRRHAFYTEAMRLRGEGGTQEEVAQKLSLRTRTLRRWEQAGQFPERGAARPRRTLLSRFLPHLEERRRQGVHNGKVLWRELQQQGYRGSRGTVQRWATCQRRIQPVVQQPQRLPVRVPRPRQAAWWLQCEASALTAEQQAFVSAFAQRCPAVAEAAQLAREFAALWRRRQADQLTNWLDRAEQSGLHSLAASLRREEAAVRAAFALPWSNGQTEAQVHRLKLLKRQTDGRAQFDLLKARLLYRAA